MSEDWSVIRAHKVRTELKNAKEVKSALDNVNGAGQTEEFFMLLKIARQQADNYIKLLEKIRA